MLKQISLVKLQTWVNDSVHPIFQLLMWDIKPSSPKPRLASRGMTFDDSSLRLQQMACFFTQPLLRCASVSDWTSNSRALNSGKKLYFDSFSKELGLQES